MIDESELRAALVANNEELKTQYIMISSVLAELAALRETVRGLDPTFGDVMEQKRRESAERNAPIVQSVIGGYDEKSRLLKDGLVC
jgi:hypothetical protein